MKRLLLIALLAGLSCVASAQPTAAASCPALLPDTQLRQLHKDDELVQYTTLRWILCGPEAGLPLLPVVRDVLRAAVNDDDVEYDADAADMPAQPSEPDDIFFKLVAAALHMNSALLIDGIATTDQHPAAEREITASLAPYLHLRVSKAQMQRHYEQGLRPAIDFLRREPLSPIQDQLLELALVAQEIRQGRIDVARAHLAKVVATGPVRATRLDPFDVGSEENDSEQAEGETEELLRGRLQVLTETLAPVQQISLASYPQRWVLDKSTDRRRGYRCGMEMFAEMFGGAELRTEVLRRAEPDAAIAELLSEEWYELIDGRPSSELLREFLRKRYSPAELQAALGDALVTVRNENGSAGLMLFGQSLPLPIGVIEDDSSVASGTKERPLAVAELVALVQASDLYRELQGQATADSSTD